MHLEPILHVLTHDVRLGRALVDLCRRVEGLQIGGIRPVEAFAPERASLVLSPTPECTTGICEQIVRGGAKVIVLAPIPRDIERLAYIGAGAHAYLPMELRSNTLLATVSEASDALRRIACGSEARPA
jgi:hypothetical protein